MRVLSRAHRALACALNLARAGSHVARLRNGVMKVKTLIGKSQVLLLLLLTTGSVVSAQVASHAPVAIHPSGDFSTTRAFEAEDMGKFYVPLPSGDQRTQLTSSFQKVMGHAPTDAELQQWYTRYKMAGGK